MSFNSKLEEQKKLFLSEKPISDKLPIKLKNGCTVSVINGQCSQCSNVVPDKFVRGKIISSLPNVVSFDAQAICPDCNVIFPVFGRIRGVDKGMQMEWLNNGQWVFSTMKKETFFEKIINYFKNKFDF